MTTITTVETVRRDADENMRPAAAAKYLGVSKSFLDQARVTGTGPQYVKISPTMVIYRRVDLNAWLSERVVRSTAEGERLSAAHDDSRRT